MAERRGFLDEYFQISERGSSIPTEILGGVVTFMAMAYILVVHPSIMAAGGKGMPREAVFTATAIIAGVSSIVMGLWAKLPFSLAPGMGSNAIMIGLVGAGLITWQQGIGMVVISGTLFVLVSWPILRCLWLFGVRNPKILNFNLRQVVVEAIPVSVKFGVSFCIGLQLAILGAGRSGIGFALINNNSFVLGNLTDPRVALGLAGLLTILAMVFLRRKNNDRPLVPGGYLIGMLAITAIAIYLGMVKTPPSWITQPPSVAPVFWAFELSGSWIEQVYPYILVFFMGDFFSTAGTALACAEKAGLMDDDGNVPRLNQVFYVDSLFTVIGAFFGLTVVTTFVESSAGVESGARTGFASLVTGGLFLAALFLSPLFLMIPPMATGAALFAVGIGMMLGIRRIVRQTEDDQVELVSVLMMIAFYALLRNTAGSMCFGIIANGLLRTIRFLYTRPPINRVKLVAGLLLFALGVSYFVVQIISAPR
ncbi:MAG: NCS2 family permease [Synergistaceae bacterium]|jgi:AGZA family xanthine/uracil permease-like MFS transporter|nr:NCS2 family permease [Synergistaceae bacterium]